MFFAIFAAPLGDLCGLGSCTSCKKFVTAKCAKESQSSQRALCDTPRVASQPGAIRSLFIDGPAGRLEALLNSGAENASHAALICHPHPVYGGTMHNKVVFHGLNARNSLGF